MLAADRWHILGDQRWHNSGAPCRYISGENTWHNLGDQTRYIITRLMTRPTPDLTTVFIARGGPGENNFLAFVQYCTVGRTQERGR